MGVYGGRETMGKVGGDGMALRKKDEVFKN